MQTYDADTEKRQSPRRVAVVCFRGRFNKMMSRVSNVDVPEEIFTGGKTATVNFLHDHIKSLGYHPVKSSIYFKTTKTSSK